MPKVKAGPFVKGAFVQTRPVFGKTEENAENAVKLASQIKSDIYVFPELSTTGYAFTSKAESLALSEHAENGKSVEKYRSFSEKNRCVVVAGFAEKDDDQVYNSSVIFERGALLGTYRKMHLFYREKIWFSTSDVGFKVFNLETLGCKIGVLICFDWVFPEATRELMLRGAEVICHPSNLVLPGKAQTGTLTRAFENRVFYITANRVGKENRGPKDNFKYTGRSQIVSPLMERLVAANATEVVAKVARLDLSRSRNKNATSMNNLIEDRRLAYYTEAFKEQEAGLERVAGYQVERND